MRPSAPFRLCLRGFPAATAPVFLDEQKSATKPKKISPSPSYRNIVLSYT